MPSQINFALLRKAGANKGCEFSYTNTFKVSTMMSQGCFSYRSLKLYKINPED